MIFKIRFKYKAEVQIFLLGIFFFCEISVRVIGRFSIWLIPNQSFGFGYIEIYSHFKEKILCLNYIINTFFLQWDVSRGHEILKKCYQYKKNVRVAILTTRCHYALIWVFSTKYIWYTSNIIYDNLSTISIINIVVPVLEPKEVEG